MKAFISNIISAEEAVDALTKTGKPDAAGYPELNKNFNFHEIKNDSASSVDLMGWGDFSPILLKALRGVVKAINDGGGPCSEEYFLERDSSRVFLITPTPNGYFRLEQTRPNRNPRNWHVDTGDRDHMTWCNYGTSLLLSRPDSFKGAELEYCNCNRNSDAAKPSARGCRGTDSCKNGIVVTKEEHYLGLGVHSNDVKHRVRCGKDSTDGVREGLRDTLLMFL